MTDIDLLRQIRNKINLEKNRWINIYTTNCYAYALGLDIPENEIMEYAFCPGTISDSPIMLCEYEFFSYSQLINSVYSDLEALGIEFREIDSCDIVPYDEWKMAIFTTPSTVKRGDIFEDYHFLRFRKDNIWHHKNGWNDYPTIFDDNNKVIRDLEKCCFYDKIYNTCLSLKLKK